MRSNIEFCGVNSRGLGPPFPEAMIVSPLIFRFLHPSFCALRKKTASRVGSLTKVTLYRANPQVHVIFPLRLAGSGFQFESEGLQSRSDELRVKAKNLTLKAENLMGKAENLMGKAKNWRVKVKNGKTSPSGVCQMGTREAVKASLS
jgi:hypothetical protein